MNKYIFFIHGYSTNSKKTWGDFPDYLKENKEIPHVIDFLDYKSPAKWKVFASSPSLFNIAEGMLTKLKNKCMDFQKDEIILIGHSNGGVVIKKILQRFEAWGYDNNIVKVCFLDVPHHGSGLASIGKLINPRNKHVKSLPINSDDLLEINDYWSRGLANNRVEVLNLVADNDDVVASMSSRFNITDSITIPRTDHGTIAKPSSSTADVVVEVVRFIVANKPLDKYKNVASQSYAEWRRFDRHHTLDYVADELRRSSYQALCEAMASPIPLVRLTGLSGLGKSRLIVEYIEEVSLKDDQILIFDASKGAVNVLRSLANAVDDGASGLIIIENCKVKLHDDLRRLFPSDPSRLQVVTVNFYHEVVANSTHTKLEKLQSNEVVELIKSILQDIKDDQLLKITKFVEGFPLLVDMVTSQLLEDGSISANLTESDLVEKLINGDGSLEPRQRELLKVFSLFDSFQFQDDSTNPSEVIEFICGIAEAGRLDFDSTITKYKLREIVNYSGKSVV